MLSRNYPKEGNVVSTTISKPRAKKSPPISVEVTLADFDTNEPFRVVRDGVPISEFTPLTLADYAPRGGTPLRDATAKFIAHLAGRAKEGTVTIGLLLDRSGSMGGNESSVVAGVNEFVGSIAGVSKVDPATSGKVLAVILTDGQENSSHEVDAGTLAASVAEREKQGWTFIYLGANQDAWATGQSFGLSGTASGQTYNYTSSPMGVRGAMGSAGVSASSFVTDSAAYLSTAGASPQGTILEDGTLVGANTPSSPPPAPITPPVPVGSKYDPKQDIKSATKWMTGS
jgi:hypothetical protein